LRAKAFSDRIVAKNGVEKKWVGVKGRGAIVERRETAKK
jgi:hypothetical protein